MEKFIELKQVELFSDNFTILDSISLTIPLGKTTFILGPSGSGKSSLVKVIAGLINPDHGSVEVLGRDYRDMNPHEQRNFRTSASFLFQDAALWANQTVYNNLQIPLRHHFPNLSADAIRYQIEGLLNRVGYTESRDLRPDSLSFGEQKLVAMARSLVLNPPILFLDEATSYIDETGSRRIKSIIRESALAGKTIVAAGNLYELAFRIADYLCIINKGRLVYFGTIFNSVSHWPEFLEPLEDSHRRILDKRQDGGTS